MRYSWEQRLAIHYYNRLYKEYALVDLTYYEINKIGMRWRTEREVIDGKGQFSCGNLHCDNTNTHELCSYEVPFRYKDLEGKVVSTLVKVRLCGPCAYSNERKFTSRLKLFHRKIREIESEHPEFRKKRKACETSQDVFDYITSILKEEGPFSSSFLMHGYAGPPDYVQKLVDLGAYFSVSGYLFNLSPKRRKAMEDTIRKFPLDRILLESDAPDMVGLVERKG